MKLLYGDRNDLIPSVVWLIIGAATIYISLTLDLGTFRAPGPGMWPLILGCIFSVLALMLFIPTALAVLNRQSLPKRIWRNIAYYKVLLVAFSMLMYGFFISDIGFPLSVFLLMTFLLSVISKMKLHAVLIGALLTTATAYLVFVVLLEVPFPMFPWHIIFG